MSTTHDLGTCDESLLVFGGPYSNLQATEALLAAAAGHGIPASRIICTGDVVAYCGQPQETVDLIRASGMAVVMGNCEESLGSDAEDCGCGFQEGSSCDLLSVQWYRFAAAALDRSAKAWMRNLPRRIDVTLGKRRLAVIHGGVGQINRFLFPASPKEDLLAELAAAGADGEIAGHSGLPFTLVLDGRLWHNAGVIGMPANDGTPRVWYSLLVPQDDGLLIQHHPLDYNWTVAKAAMAGHDLPAGYAEALASGLWPTDEIMPPADRAAGGRPLAFAPAFWDGAARAQAI